MTTIILTIIGILLAAAAALMVIFYGGDAFNAGATNAAAASYQNAGDNVLSAMALYEAEKGTLVGLTIPILLSSNCIAGGSCLTEEPNLPTIIDANTITPLQEINDGQYIVNNIERLVCEQINRNLRTPAGIELVSAEVKMGCALPPTGRGTFYANGRIQPS